MIASVEFNCGMHCRSSDGNYILTGGEDDLVQVWSMEDQKIVAWGEGHNSWVNYIPFVFGSSISYFKHLKFLTS